MNLKDCIEQITIDGYKFVCPECDKEIVADTKGRVLSQANHHWIMKHNS